MDLETNHGVSRLPAILPSALKEKLLPLLMTTLGDIIHVCFVVSVTSCSILVPSSFFASCYIILILIYIIWSTEDLSAG